MDSAKPRLPLWVYKVAILSATMMWGLSFIILKDAVETLPPSWLVAVRFIICGILLIAIFWKRFVAHLDWGHLLHGIIIGALLFTAYWFQTYGLTDTTPGKNAFLTAAYCIIVPFVWWIVARRRPTGFNLIAAVVCVIGIGFVSMTGEDLSEGITAIRWGDAMTLVCAVFFALHIVYVAKVTPGRDVYVLTAYQFLFAGIFALVVGIFTEELPSTMEITWTLVGQMAYLTLFASLIALLIQNVALQYVPPAQASLLLSLESVFGVLFSVLFYHEEISLMVGMGFCLIFIAVLVSEGGQAMLDSLKKRLAARDNTTVPEAAPEAEPIPSNTESEA